MIAVLRHVRLDGLKNTLATFEGVFPQDVHGQMPVIGENPMAEKEHINPHQTRQRQSVHHMFFTQPGG